LPQRRLPHIEIGGPLQMHSRYLVTEFHHHGTTASSQT
jgi:hypothetical protein